MRHCLVENCERHPLIEFFIPLYCDWRTVYQPSKCQLQSSAVVTKQMENERENVKISYQNMQTDSRKMQQEIHLQQKLRNELMTKEQVEILYLYKCFSAIKGL